MYVRGSDKNIEYKRDLNGFFRGIIMSDTDPTRLYRCKIFIPEVHELALKDERGTKYYIAPDKVGSLKEDIRAKLSDTLPWAEQASSLFGEQGISHYNVNLGEQTGGINYPQQSSRTQRPNSRKMALYPNQVLASRNVVQGSSGSDTNPFNPTGSAGVYMPAPNAPNAHGIHGIPSIGSHVWVFFDRGDINCPVYFAACPSAVETNLVFHDGDATYPDNNKNSDENVEDTPPEPKDPNSPTNYANGERVPGQQLPVREELKNLTPAEREEFYRLVDSEVGGQGQQARIAFMETVANRAKMNGETIPELIQKDRKRWADYKANPRSNPPGYFDTINTGAANRPLNHNLGSSLNNARETYNRDFAQVIGGSNITSGATHNASGNVAQVWNLPSTPREKGDPRGYDGLTGTDTRFGGELFYSKTNERRFRQELLESARSSNIPSSIIVDGRTLDAPLPTGGREEGPGVLPPKPD